MYAVYVCIRLLFRYMFTELILIGLGINTVSHRTIGVGLRLFTKFTLHVLNPYITTQNKPLNMNQVAAFAIQMPGNAFK